jgi:hypothetical protein
MSFPIFVLGSSAIAFATVVGTSLFSPWRNLALLAAFVGATRLLRFHGPGYLNTVPDDAYISFHYAQHLADGPGPNWNSSGRVEGYTNFSLVALLAALPKIGLDIVISARALGCLSAVGTFVAIFGIWKLWNADDPDAGVGRPSVLAATFLLLGLSSGFVIHTLQLHDVTRLSMRLTSAGNLPQHDAFTIRTRTSGLLKTDRTPSWRAV